MMSLFGVLLLSVVLYTFGYVDMYYGDDANVPVVDVGVYCQSWYRRGGTGVAGGVDGGVVDFDIGCGVMVVMLVFVRMCGWCM